MKALIIYDSYYGNTESIASKYFDSLVDYVPTLSKANEVTQQMIDSSDIIIFGSPTRMFNMTQQMKKLLKKKRITNKYIYVFDTRIDGENTKGKFLPSMMYRFGYAAEKIQEKLLKKGNTLISDFVWYYVDDAEGPLSKSFDEAFKANSFELIKCLKKLT